MADVAGTVTIAPRALSQVARAIVHDVLGSPASDTSVDLVATADGLALRVGTPAPLSAPDGYLRRLHEARQQLATRMQQLTGRRVTSVDLTVTGALAAAPRRVR